MAMPAQQAGGGRGPRLWLAARVSLSALRLAQVEGMVGDLDVSQLASEEALAQPGEPPLLLLLSASGEFIGDVCAQLAARPVGARVRGVVGRAGWNAAAPRPYRRARRLR